MDSRERVLRTLAGEETDRIPSNFRAELVTHEKLFRSTGLRMDDFLDQMDVDIRHIDAKPPAEKNMGAFYQNHWGERYVYFDSEFGPVRDDIEGALSKAETLEDLEAFPWISNDDYDYSDLSAQCDRYEGRAILYGSGDIWQRPGLVRGMGNFLMDMYDHPEFCHYLSKRYTDFYVEDYRRAFEKSGKRIDIFLIYSDLGSQRAPLISKAMLDEFVLPYLRKIAAAIHEMGAKFFFHSCGMIEPFIPQLIQCGVDILDPLQPCAEQMQPEALQAAYGGKVCFHGGIDIQSVIVRGTPEDVRKTVARYRKAFAARRYICCPSHLFQVDTPIENMRALYEEINHPRYDR